MAWTYTGGGDHEGEDWAPTSDTVGGIHYNVGTFTVAAGVTLTESTASAFKVYANTISIAATGFINGDGKGYAGGADGTTIGQAGSGPGGGEGGYYDDPYEGGGGGAYGGDGGNAGRYNGDRSGYGSGGTLYGNNTHPSGDFGSGGGGGGSNSGDGGRGGGFIVLSAAMIEIAGTVSCDGQNGQNAGNGSGAGGGSGGCIILIGGDVYVTGTLSCVGGNGRTGAIGTDVHWVDGGGGGGGRIKIFYVSTLSTTGTITVAGGLKGASGSTGAEDGDAGAYMNEQLGTCTTSLGFGQGFTIGAHGISMLDKIILYAHTVNTSGDFTLKVWDSSSKNTEYGSKTITISGTGEQTFQFSDWIALPDGEDTYWFEILADSTGDVLFSVNTYSVVADNYYFDEVAVSYWDAYVKLYSVDHVKGAIAYNTADTTVKCNLTNLMLIGAVHRVNADGTGTLQYIDDFTTNKYLADYTAISGVTHDTTDDELDIADSGYISYTIDTKYPITGIPTLTATINITAGTPTIKISSDNATYYDIDTAIVDNVSTSYPLDNATSLSLKGLTTFYLKLDCGGDGTNTCSVITMQLDVATVTETAENPLINTGTSANTFRLDQDSDSGLDCAVALIYEDRKWAS